MSVNFDYVEILCKRLTDNIIENLYNYDFVIHKVEYVCILDWRMKLAFCYTIESSESDAGPVRLDKGRAYIRI